MVLDELYTIRQIADKLHKSEQSVSRWLRDGKLEYIQISERSRVVSESILEDFLDARRIAAPKRIDISYSRNASSPKRSLTTEEGRANTNVRIPKIDWRKELSQCR
jgi:hypothetical protein